MHQSAMAVADEHFDRLETRPDAIRLSHWKNSQPVARYVLERDDDAHLVLVSLQRARIELRSGSVRCFEGVLEAGAIRIAGPARRIDAVVEGPHDILHLHVPRDLLRSRLLTISGGTAPRDLDGCTFQDALVGQLGRMLQAASAANDVIFEGAVAYAMLTYILRLARDLSRSSTLAKWRLRRVEAFIERNLAEPLSSHDLAAAAGLSRGYFATQFRKTIGCAPHHYLLCRRVETAKTMLFESDLPLVEIAHSVGFADQAHFTNVFKRLAGETPARWRSRSRRHEPALSLYP